MNNKNLFAMKRKTAIYLALALSLFMAACEKNEPLMFGDYGRVYFDERGSTSYGYERQIYEKNFTFTLVGLDDTEAETGINVSLMGRPADHDRIFRAEVVRDSTTAVEGTHFTLRDGVMKAGEHLSRLPITLYRTPDIQDKAVKITLKIASGDGLELKGGVNEATEQGFFVLHVADYLLPPQYWPTQFGTYSDNKYRFVMATLGIADFPFEARWDSSPSYGAKFTVSQLFTFQYELREAYAAYRAAGNPPIWMDDNATEKVEISF